MSFDTDNWIEKYTEAVTKEFDGRIWFLGLQGSYGRGEATEESDIDMVLILDMVSYDDLSTYSRLLDTLPNREKICGFLSGRAELEAWEKSDLFQFCQDTTPIIGSLEDIARFIGKDDVKRAIRIGACNIYHACVHNAVHEKDTELLAGLYKSAAFTLQAITYLKKGVFEKKQERLLEYLDLADRNILETRLKFRGQGQIPQDNIDSLTEELLIWSADWIKKMSIKEVCKDHLSGIKMDCRD